MTTTTTKTPKCEACFGDGKKFVRAPGSLLKGDGQWHTCTFCNGTGHVLEIDTPMPDICPVCGEPCQLDGDAMCFECQPTPPRFAAMLEDLRRDIENAVMCAYADRQRRHLESAVR